MVKEGFGKNNPYVVGVVELEEGAKIVARITGVDAKKPAEIKVGTPLKAEFIHSGQGPDRKLIWPLGPNPFRASSGKRGANGSLLAGLPFFLD